MILIWKHWKYCFTWTEEELFSPSPLWIFRKFSILQSTYHFSFFGRSDACFCTCNLNSSFQRLWRLARTTKIVLDRRHDWPLRELCSSLWSQFSRVHQLTLFTSYKHSNSTLNIRISKKTFECSKIEKQKTFSLWSRIELNWRLLFWDGWKTKIWNPMCKSWISCISWSLDTKIRTKSKSGTRD